MGARLPVLGVQGRGSWGPLGSTVLTAVLTACPGIPNVYSASVSRYVVRKLVLAAVLLLSILPGRLAAAGAGWSDIPSANWKGNVKAEAPALKRTAAAAVALPAKDAGPLVCSTAESLPAGLYEVRLTLRPSHVAGLVAFNCGVKVSAAGAERADFHGSHFARVHEAETRTVQVVNPKAGPLAFSLQAYADPGAVDKARTAASLEKGGPQLGE